MSEAFSDPLAVLLHWRAGRSRMADFFGSSLAVLLSLRLFNNHWAKGFAYRICWPGPRTDPI